jgi:hypothetical protein
MIDATDLVHSAARRFSLLLEASDWASANPTTSILPLHSFRGRRSWEKPTTIEPQTHYSSTTEFIVNHNTHSNVNVVKNSRCLLDGAMLGPCDLACFHNDTDDVASTITIIISIITEQLSAEVALSVVSN